MCHIFFIHSSVDGHLGCFHVLAIVKRAAMNILVHESFWIMVFSGYMPSSGIAGSYGSSIWVGWWNQVLKIIPSSNAVTTSVALCLLRVSEPLVINSFPEIKSGKHICRFREAGIGRDSNFILLTSVLTLTHFRLSCRSSSWQWTWHHLEKFIRGVSRSEFLNWVLVVVMVVYKFSNTYFSYHISE